MYLLYFLDVINYSTPMLVRKSPKHAKCRTAHFGVIGKSKGDIGRPTKIFILPYTPNNRTTCIKRYISIDGYIFCSFVCMMAFINE